MEPSRLLVGRQPQLIGELEHQRLSDAPMKIDAVVSDRLRRLHAVARHALGGVETGQRVVSPVNRRLVEKPLPVQVKIMLAAAALPHLEHPAAELRRDRIPAVGGGNCRRAHLQRRIRHAPLLGLGHRQLAGKHRRPRCRHKRELGPGQGVTILLARDIDGKPHLLRGAAGIMHGCQHLNISRPCRQQIFHEQVRNVD